MVNVLTCVGSIKLILRKYLKVLKSLVYRLHKILEPSLGNRPGYSKQVHVDKKIQRKKTGKVLKFLREHSVKSAEESCKVSCKILFKGIFWNI